MFLVTYRFTDTTLRGFQVKRLRKSGMKTPLSVNTYLKWSPYALLLSILLHVLLHWLVFKREICAHWGSLCVWEREWSGKLSLAQKDKTQSAISCGSERENAKVDKNKWSNKQPSLAWMKIVWEKPQSLPQKFCIKIVSNKSIKRHPHIW